MNEATLGRVLDDLIDMASNQTPGGLRALGATAQVPVTRLRRLVAAGQSIQAMVVQTGGRLVSESPPLATLFSALTLFTEAFNNGRAGSRLIFVARPPLLSYGFYGASGSVSDAGADTLNRLMVERSRIAEQVDCFMLCECSAEVVRRQVQLDLLVYQLDRAIDLYALGEPGRDAVVRTRAMAVGALVSGYLDPRPPLSNGRVERPLLSGSVGLTPLKDALTSVETDLGWLRWRNWGREFRTQEQGVRFLDDNPAAPRQPPAGQLATTPDGKPHTERAEVLHAELCAMSEVETGWEAMVSALAPSCLRDAVTPQVAQGQKGGASVSAGRQLIEQGKVEVEYYLLTRRTCMSFTVSISPNLETSLDAIANDVPANGFGP